MVRYLFLAFSIIVVDQLTKIYVLLHLDPFETINLLPFLNITLTNNFGAAFGILANQSGWQKWFFLSIAVLVSTCILFWLKKSIEKQKQLESFALVLILGGAIGNLIDRVFYGSVIDFIDFYIKDWHWYTFNISDTAICVGSSILLLEIFFFKRSL